MKTYEDFRIFYKDKEITNILSLTEKCSYAYGEKEEVDSLYIKYINEQGKLVTEEYDIKDLTFKDKHFNIIIDEVHDNIEFTRELKNLFEQFGMNSEDYILRRYENE